MPASPNGQRNQHIQADLLALAPHQIGDAGLRYVERLGGPVPVPDDEAKLASSGEKSRSAYTLPLDSMIFSASIQLPSNLSETSAGEFDVFLQGFLCLFRERMQHINRISELGYVNNAPFAERMHVDFLYADTNGIYRLTGGRFKYGCACQGSNRQIAEIS
jgi:hypothetical protein